ncbi:serine hydrolase domain-containing protein [Mucilaginibacter boryungensis]|uniref:Beta-lactamase family protein n=1 Tax=Mucilaginibacter boryungensis TaxID=768480 RepID=A0ABR9XEJ3_9SPHI|nr:serine hydrolase domain-containing protein [Mucilaginibacter boryungensis]MBE9665804.1 beta-lactamase family protein [Mucilaginibacter boryungensis]
MILFKHFLIALLIIFTSLSSFAQNEKAEANIREVMKQYDAVGLSVAVVKNNKIIYTHSFGLKNIEHNTPLSDNDIFRIASISKSFSATSIMQLAAAGKLSLDEDFSKLIGFKVRNPKFPDKVITLKMVMSHTASLNDSQGYFSLDGINPDKGVNWAKCYNNYEPGTDYQYCNLDYNMIGTVIEKISGERFDQYVKHHVLDPLGLYAGYCVDSLDNSRFVTIYEYDAKTKQFTPDPGAYNPRREEIKNYVMGYSTPIFSPTGGMKISATDLAKYMMMHMNYGKYPGGNRIIEKKYSKIMQTKVTEKDGYGLAIRTVDDLIPGVTMKGHTGSAYGLFSGMFFQPDKKFGIVVITNGTSAPETDGFNALIKASINSLYNDFIK